MSKRAEEVGFVLSSSGEKIRYQLGFETARRNAAASRHARALSPVVDAIARQPYARWSPLEAAAKARLKSSEELDRLLQIATGLTFAQIVDLARLDRSLQDLERSQATVDQVAEEYRWSQSHLAIGACEASREDLDAAFVRVLGFGLDVVVGSLILDRLLNLAD